MSVVFDFNDSLNDLAPVSPILLPVDTKRNGKEWFVDECLLYVFCCYNPDWGEWASCLISMLHSMTLLPCFQCSCLLMWREKKRVIDWWMSFACLLSFVFTQQIEFSECCVWFQCLTQWRCSCVSNIIACWCEKWERANCWWMSFVCLLLSLLHRLSSVSVVFDFNASLNDVVPVSPILLPVE